MTSAGSDHEKVARRPPHGGRADRGAGRATRLHELPHALINGLTPAKAEALEKALKAAGAEAEVEPLKTYNWPLPYDELTNPLSIDLTAGNTFILICSSVTMVLALAALPARRQAALQPVPAGDRADRVVLPGRPGLRVLPVDGGAPLSAGHQRHGPLPAEREPVRVVLLHDDRVPRGARLRRRGDADLHLHPVAPRGVQPRTTTARSSWSGSTGTSSTSSGSSCSPSSTSSDRSTADPSGGTADVRETHPPTPDA